MGINVKSPTGKVHRVTEENGIGGSRVVCNHGSMSGWWGPIKHFHSWPKTDKPVNCLRCLAKMKKEGLR